MSKRRRNDDAALGDLFDQAFPVRAPAEPVPAMDFSVRLSQAIGRALKECPLSREDVAAKMSAMLGEPVSRMMLDAYASPARDTHRIGLTRFKALARVTGCLWLWEVAVDGDGLTLLQGEQARLAQIGALEQQVREMSVRLKDLKKAPSVSLKPLRGDRA